MVFSCHLRGTPLNSELEASLVQDVHFPRILTSQLHLNWKIHFLCLIYVNKRYLNIVIRLNNGYPEISYFLTTHCKSKSILAILKAENYKFIFTLLLELSCTSDADSNKLEEAFSFSPWKSQKKKNYKLRINAIHRIGGVFNDPMESVSKILILHDSPYFQFIYNQDSGCQVIWHHMIES